MMEYWRTRAPDDCKTSIISSTPIAASKNSPANHPDCYFTLRGARSNRLQTDHASVRGSCPAQGMIRVMDAKSELLDEIVARLTAVARPVRVIVFGSAATDSGTADSDIDLLIVLDEVGDARLESVRLRRALRGVGMPLDVIVMRTDRFEETKNVVGGIAYPANRYGKVIYEAA